jgi:hypothetical protein
VPRVSFGGRGRVRAFTMPIRSFEQVAMHPGPSVEEIKRQFRSRLLSWESLPKDITNIYVTEIHIAYNQDYGGHRGGPASWPVLEPLLQIEIRVEGPETGTDTGYVRFKFLDLSYRSPERRRSPRSETPGPDRRS